MKVSMTDFYKAQQVLMNGIIYVPREDRMSALDAIVSDFRPPGVPMRAWMSDVHNHVIGEWVDQDPVFKRAFEKNYVENTEEAREGLALLAGLDYATRHGLWRNEYKKLLVSDDDEDITPI